MLARSVAAGLARLPAWGSAEALSGRTPILSEPPPVRGTVHILVERCKGCELCVEYCPADVLALSAEFNVKGYHYPIVVSGDCIVCQACSTICPEFAIFPLAFSAARSVDGQQRDPDRDALPPR